MRRGPLKSSARKKGPPPEFTRDAPASDPDEQDRDRSERARIIREELRDSRAKTIKGTNFRDSH